MEDERNKSLGLRKGVGTTSLHLLGGPGGMGAP